MANAMLATVMAWFAGMFIDANFIEFLELRVLLPVITMGYFILKQFEKK